MPSYKILVLDNQPLMRDSIERLVVSIISNAQVFQSDSTTSALTILRDNEINLIILEINLEVSDGFEFIRRVKAHGYSGKVLFFSGSKHTMFSQAAFKLGADGYLSKLESSKIIKEAILAIIQDGSAFRYNAQSKPIVCLSSRETTVLNYLLQGYSNKRISELLSLSAKTISTYKSRILSKYEVDTMFDLIQMKEHQLLSQKGSI
ncbi:response regulator transcription factor [Vibrio coralliilyticus]|uniref:response regulator transcription factor n=1 Tax=Vibrio coralliilyticus TaxID=190893 RepID=UPI00156134EC|nr:response regulator transcription factor [Vibrio coralliilyticus]NRF60855.1 response regulator transcription factor [Vibrio coralliilyticus]